ncbi:DUF397 domain-containing protein [Streptomyces sp. NPDC051662]|uniref:DUF397 domain-containing protein n=1 Tax=Streptomyces sp. NPDC051662 TaxID=3154750 RepID=UPI00343E0740
MRTLDLSGARWEKSSYSADNEGQCVEFTRTFALSGIVPVRDSKSPTGPVLLLTPTAWNDFVVFAARPTQ